MSEVVLAQLYKLSYVLLFTPDMFVFTFKSKRNVLSNMRSVFGTR